MKRIADLVTGDQPRATRYGRLYADPRTVELVRRVARLEHWGITRCLDELLRAYVELRRPEWQVIEADVPAVKTTKQWVDKLKSMRRTGKINLDGLKLDKLNERRTAAERRGTKPDVGRPASVADRRRKPRRA